MPDRNLKLTFDIARTASKADDVQAGLFSLGYLSMSQAIRSIVDGYFSLKDRTKLEELRTHRQQLRKQLQDHSGGPFDVSHSIRICDQDLEVIEAAIDRL